MGFLIHRNDNQFNSLSSFQNEMHRLMEDFFSNPWSGFSPLTEDVRKTIEWKPRINVSETEKEYRVSAELPGLEEKDIDITLDDNVLFIKGERQFKKEDEGENYHHVESVYGSCQRTIPFNKTIDPEKVSARFENGVLNIKLEKASDDKNGARKININ